MARVSGGTAGGGGVTDHTQLTGVAPHQHLDLLSGLDANKPAAAFADRLYVATDTGIVYRDTTTVWVESARLESATRLAQLSEKAHTSLTGVGVNDHHNQAHAKADHNGAAIPGSADESLGAHYLDVAQIAAPANPAAGTRRLYFDSTTGKLSVRTSAGASVSLEEQAASSPLTTKGDLFGFDTGNARIPAGANDTFLTYDSAQALGVRALQRNRALDEVHADASVVNSTAETTLASLTLPAGIVAAGDMVLFVAGGDFLNNSGAGVTYQYRFKIGATTVLASAATSVATSTSRRKWYLILLVAIESTTAQRVAGTLYCGGQTASSWDTAAAGPSVIGYGSAAEDTSTSKACALTAQLGTANAAADMVLHFASLQLVKK